MEPFIAARGRSLALTILVVAQVVTLAAATVAWGVGGASLDNDLTSAAGAFAAASGLEIFDLLLFIAATVVFLTWVYRAIANLPALGSMSCRFTPSGAVWSYFIPFVNLVRGHQVMATVWTESQPPAVNENGFYLPRKATLVHWWWGLYIFSGIASYAAGTGRAFGIEELRSTAHAQLFLHAIRIATALLFLFMVRGAQKRQEDQWQDLERRRNVPQPTADALR